MAYAEGTLGVHDVYEQAKAAQQDLKDAQTAMVTWADAKRTLIEAMNDRGAILASDERAKYSDLSATAFEQHMKGASQMDPDLRRLREEYRAAQREHDQAEADVKQHEKRCDMYSGRMEQLGGLLHFYAAVKVTRSSSS